jgi:hypothetical protein
MTNVRIIGNLGHATLDLADAARHLLVEAGPLAEWLSQNAAQGAKLTDEWVKNKRATGDLSKFFQRARGDLTLLASIGGHAGRGILNLFGAQDVDGTKTLASLNGIFARFEQWSNEPGGAGRGRQGDRRSDPERCGRYRVGAGEHDGRRRPEGG